MDKIGKEFQLDEYYLELLDEGNLGLNVPSALENKVRYIAQDEIIDHPYPGIRPFKTTEAPIFFGRDGQADKLIEKLNDYNFLGVIGSSGSGKSSLIRAGLIPHLFAGYHKDGSSNWQVAICRPGDDPISNISAALAGVQVGSREADEILEDARRIRTELNENPYGLVDVGEEITKGKSRLLIVIDQFEELFRFKREVNSMDSHHFVNLLMNVAEEPESNIFIAITMRSEYLGDCVHFNGLTEAINRGQYLVPRLGRKELKAAIQGPAQMAGAEIDKGLLNKLISEIGDNMDQLPILQHALMRTYECWKKDENASTIQIDHYKAAGEMKGALAQHADEIISAFTPSQKQISKVIFQRITDRSSDDRGIRRPCYLLQIYEVCQFLHGKYLLDGIVSKEKSSGAVQISATRSDINEVIETLRDERNAFLMPPKAVQLVNNPVIDISHESIMRNWETLKEWIEEELRDGAMYKRLDQSRRDKIEDDARGTPHPFLSGALLQDLKESHKNNEKNAAWAARYHATKSAPYQELLEVNGEEDFLKNRSRQKAYPLKTDAQVYDLNVDYFLACIDHERGVMLAKKRRKRLLIYFSVLAFFTVVGIALYFAFERDRLEKVFNSKSTRLRQLEFKVDGKVHQAEFAREKALNQERIAQMATDSANLELQKAQKAKRNAEIQAQKARDAAAEARIAEQRANEAKQIAMAAAENAQRRKAWADSSVAIALREKQQLDSAISKLDTKLADVETYNEQLLATLNAYLTYEKDISSTEWYSTLPREARSITDSLLFPYYHLEDSLRNYIASDYSHDSIPAKRMLSLQLASAALSKPMGSAYAQIALTNSALDLERNPLTVRVNEQILKQYQNIEFASEIEGYDRITQWKDNNNPLTLADDKLYTFEGANEFVLFEPYSVGKDESIAGISATTGQALIAKKEENLDWDYATTTTYTIVYPDPSSKRTTVVSETGGTFVGATKDFSHLVFDEQSHISIFDNTGTKLLEVSNEFNGGRHNFSGNGNYLVLPHRYPDEAGMKFKRVNLKDGTVLDFEIEGDVFQMAIMNDGNHVYYTESNGMSLYKHNIVTGKTTKKTYSDPIAYFNLSDDNTFIALSVLPNEEIGFDEFAREAFMEFRYLNISSTVHIVDEATKKEINRINWPNETVTKMTFSPDNSKLIAESDFETYIFNKTKEPLTQAAIMRLFESEDYVNLFVELARYSDYGYYDQGSTAGKEFIDACIALGYENSSLYIFMGKNALGKGGDLEKASAYFDKAASLNSENNTDIMYEVGRGYMKARNYGGAARQAEKFVQYSTDNYAFNMFDAGMKYQYKSFHETNDTLRRSAALESVKWYKEALDNNPSGWYASRINTNLAYAYILADDSGKALSLIKNEKNDISAENRTRLKVLYGLQFNKVDYIADNKDKLGYSFDFLPEYTGVLKAQSELTLSSNATGVALDYLRESASEGFSDAPLLDSIKVFDVLRNLPEYQEILDQVKENYRYELSY